MKNLVNNLRRIGNRVFEKGEYEIFLNLAARFPNLSLYNILLLYYQMPQAVLVAGEQAWKDNYDLDVKDGEMAISLVRPTLVDEEETTLGYAQIGVFDVSQLERTPDIKKEEYSIPNFFFNETGCTLSYDMEEMLGEKEYEVIDEEFYVPYFGNMSEEENTKNVNKQMLTSYIYDYSGLRNETAEERAVVQSVKYILCTRYGLDALTPNPIMIANCRSYGLGFLNHVLQGANEVIEKIENSASVEFNFADLAFTNLLVEANSKDDYDYLCDIPIEDDDEIMYESVSKFVEKLDLLSPAAFEKIYEDRKNNKMLTQPPYKVKLIEDC